MSTIRRRVRAHGRVQGVFFRDSTRSQAEAHDVAGWVRNCSDGSVEAAFEGPPQAVEALIDFVRSGPGHARVQRVDVSDEEPTGETGFDVR